jgi:hypothetical protein
VAGATWSDSFHHITKHHEGYCSALPSVNTCICRHLVNIYILSWRIHRFIYHLYIQCITDLHHPANTVVQLSPIRLTRVHCCPSIAIHGFHYLFYNNYYSPPQASRILPCAEEWAPPPLE